MIAQVSAGPSISSTDAVSGNPANSQPTPGKPIRPSGSSYPASAAGLRRTTRFGIFPLKTRGVAAIASRPAARCRAVIHHIAKAKAPKPTSTHSAAGTRTSACQGSSAETAVANAVPPSIRCASTAENATPAA